VVLLPISSLKQMSYKAKAASVSRQLPFLTTSNPVEPSLEDMNLNYGKIKYYSFDTDLESLVSGISSSINGRQARVSQAQITAHSLRESAAIYIESAILHSTSNIKKIYGK
jgi:hypothetical protein